MGEKLTDYDDWKALMEGRFWLELRRAGEVPHRKGSWPLAAMKGVLREFMAANPDAMISVVTISHDGPFFEDAPEALCIIDRRTWPTGKRHLASSYAAFAAVHEKDRFRQRSRRAALSREEGR
jgi:hypothetical protein